MLELDPYKSVEVSTVFVELGPLNNILNLSFQGVRVPLYIVKQFFFCAKFETKILTYSGDSACCRHD